MNFINDLRSLLIRAVIAPTLVFYTLIFVLIEVIIFFEWLTQRKLGNYIPRACLEVIELSRFPIFKERIILWKVLSSFSNKVDLNHKLHGLPLIENKHISQMFDNLFHDTFHGIYILISPKGTGKTTNVYEAILRHQKRGGKSILFQGVPKSEAEFLQVFGASSLDALFNALPADAVVIMDQFDIVEDTTPEILNMLRNVGIKSMNNKRGNFILCVSNIEVAVSILRLNGHEKIRQFGKTKDFLWNEGLVSRFVESWCSHLNAQEKEMIKELGNKAQSPGFLFDISHQSKNGSPIDLNYFESRANVKSELWKKFNEFDFAAASIN